jgi:hypothetical protein
MQVNKHNGIAIDRQRAQQSVCFFVPTGSAILNASTTPRRLQDGEKYSICLQHAFGPSRASSADRQRYRERGAWVFAIAIAAATADATECHGQ